MANASKYPEILIDESYHSPNGALNKHNLTVEEFYDLMHHSHPEFENSSSGSGEGASSQEVIELTNRITRMQTTIDEQSANISHLQSIIEDLQEQVSRISQTNEQTSITVNSLNNTITQLQEDNVRRDQNAFDVGDWNAMTPEIEQHP